MVKVALGAVAALLIAWVVLYFGVYIGFGNWTVRNHQEFARNGISQIRPAAEMEKLYADCRHYIVYTGPESVSTWNATAFFGGRYELTMQVPVEIKSKDAGAMIGKPKFYLHEVGEVSVSSSGQVGASFARVLQFDESEWEKVYRSNGDFSVIGFTVRKTAVPNFQKYADASRPSD
jgi:hypothetical protein